MSVLFTVALLIPNEQKDTLRETILKTCLPIRPTINPPTVIKTDSAPSFKSLKNDGVLLTHHISIEIVNPKNLNHNPVAEKAV